MWRSGMPSRQWRQSGSRCAHTPGAIWRRGQVGERVAEWGAGRVSAAALAPPLLRGGAPPRAARHPGGPRPLSWAAPATSQSLPRSSPQGARCMITWPLPRRNPYRTPPDTHAPPRADLLIAGRAWGHLAGRARRRAWGGVVRSREAARGRFIAPLETRGLMIWGRRWGRGPSAPAGGLNAASKDPRAAKTSSVRRWARLLQAQARPPLPCVPPGAPGGALPLPAHTYRAPARAAARSPYGGRSSSQASAP
jgi:hypothetical protein